VLGFRNKKKYENFDKKIWMIKKKGISLQPLRKTTAGVQIDIAGVD